MNSKGFRGKRKNEFSFYEFMTQEFRRDLKELGDISQGDLSGFCYGFVHSKLQTNSNLKLTHNHGHTHTNKST